MTVEGKLKDWSKKYCCDCKKELDSSKSGECWSDNPNALTHPHLGGIKCRGCYAKTHNFCPKCVYKPMDKAWLHCPWCGVGIQT